MPRQEGGHEQLSYKRAQKQADEAVDGGSKGQIELRRKAVEHRLGYLTSTISFILGDILGRNYRAQQIGAAFDPVIGGTRRFLGPLWPLLSRGDRAPRSISARNKILGRPSTEAEIAFMAERARDRARG